VEAGRLGLYGEPESEAQNGNPGEEATTVLAFLRASFWFFAFAHLAFGIAGVAFPAWFFAAVPPWRPLHVGQIQIAGVFDLCLAALFFAGGWDFERYLPLVTAVGAVGECGHAAVRIGHVALGDNPGADLMFPSIMLGYGLILVCAFIASRAFLPRLDSPPHKPANHYADS